MDTCVVPVYRSADRPGFLETGTIFSFITDRDFTSVEHCHDFYEILFLFNGEVLHEVNGKGISMHSGDAFILCPGDRHLSYRKSSSLSACMFSAVPELIEPFFKAYGICSSDSFFTPLVRLDARQKESALYIFKRMQFISTDEKKKEIRILLGQLFLAYAAGQRNPELNWMDRLTDVMRNPENLRCGVSALQNVANLSHSQLCRVFRKLTGQTPQSFLITLRLGYAHDMICNTNIPFEQISLDAGYASFSHFSKLFKKHYGITPSALRKSVLKYW